MANLTVQQVDFSSLLGVLNTTQIRQEKPALYQFLASLLTKNTDLRNAIISQLLTDDPGNSVGEINQKVCNSDDTDSDNTLHNDPELFFAMKAREVYIVELNLSFTTGTVAVPDAKVSISLPTLATVSGTVYGTETGATVTNDVWVFGGAFQISSPALFGAFGVVSTAVSGTTPINLNLVVRNGANAGNFQLQWAQNVTTPATPTLRKADSWMRYTRVS